MGDTIASASQMPPPSLIRRQPAAPHAFLFHGRPDGIVESVVAPVNTEQVRRVPDEFGTGITDHAFQRGIDVSDHLVSIENDDSLGHLFHHGGKTQQLLFRLPLSRGIGKNGETSPELSVGRHDRRRGNRRGNPAVVGADEHRFVIARLPLSSSGQFPLHPRPIVTIEKVQQPAAAHVPGTISQHLAKTRVCERNPQVFVVDAQAFIHRLDKHTDLSLTLAQGLLDPLPLLDLLLQQLVGGTQLGSPLLDFSLQFLLRLPEYPLGPESKGYFASQFLPGGRGGPGAHANREDQVHEESDEQAQGKTESEYHSGKQERSRGRSRRIGRSADLPDGKGGTCEDQCREDGRSG